MARDKYEISLWEDYVVAAAAPVPEHFEERKLVVIGSDTMTAACRAYEPKLIENINGTNTFTFKMFYTYRDEQTGEKRQNPFLSLLVNERKVKVHWKNRWYDLVIKNIQEDSSGKSITYTCKDLFINELSKNGFNLEFDNELENNQGTVAELGARVLEGTDWQLDVAGSDSIKQEKEEPVYVGTTKAVTAINQKTGAPISIPSGKTILIFYSCVQEKTDPCQFLYDPTQEYKRDTNSQLVIDVDCYSFASPNWNSNTPSAPADLVSTMGTAVSNDYRGSRLVNSQKTVLDPVTDKYVKVYKATSSGTGYSTNDVIYGYESTEYKDPTFVNSLVVNSKNFANTEGWIGTTDNIVGPFQLYPAYSNTSDISTYDAKSYLKFGVGTIYNTGLRESGSYIPDGIQNGEKYVFRFKAMTNNNGPSGTYVSDSRIVPHIYNYTYTSGNIIPDTSVDYISRDSYSTNGDWRECNCTCIKSFSRNQVYSNNIGLFFTVSSVCWIEEIEFFQFAMGEVSIDATTFNANKTLYYTYNITTKVYTQCTNASVYSSTTSYYKRINPGEMDSTSVATTYYHYYNHTTHTGVIELDDYLYVGTTDWANKPLSDVSNDFAKVRSITAKQSNRFNLLQTLAETFECWCEFEIIHWGDDPNEDLDGHSPGEIKYVNGKYQKYIRFVNQIGQETGVGFIYGIDLKTISRTIQSDQIVTKTIVSQNNNEFATNGFCTIARSPENYARDTFILNFDYYITQGLIDGGQLNKDLYSQFNGNIVQGYYSQLRELNLEYDSITDILVQKKTELTKQESYKTVYENYITSLKEEKNNIENSIMSLANVTTWAAAEAYIKQNAVMDEIKTRMNARQNCINNLANYQAMLGNDNPLSGLKLSIANLTAILNQKQERQKTLVGLIKELNYAFYKKYATYIQEGSWIDENYIDDTLYYLDAQSIAYTSSRPQISYNISVARLSSLEEFKSKVFHLGDVSYIQDTEFFGYVPGAPIPTPYKEQVLISEVTSNFDDPIQDSFKVQNYKTQFDDLFQRITATTQSLQYASGEYARAANAMETNGTIKVETLQSSIAYNQELVIQANNEQIFQDSTGITVTDATNPNKRTKITSGGIFISTDGGATWKNAIRGEGISTQYLTAGNINTQDITILDGGYQTFRWDSTGINAYSQLRDAQTGNLYGVDVSKAVRFDHYGVYGINGINGDAAAYIPPAENGEDDIWEKATFGMTWKGFFIKNKYGDHYVEVSSTEDISIYSRNYGASDWNSAVQRIKIGKLNDNNGYIPLVVQPSDWNTNWSNYYTYDSANQTYVALSGDAAPQFANNTYYVYDNVYGLRLKDSAGTTTLETIENGTLWLKDKLYIGTSNNGTYQAGLGFLPLVTNSLQQITTQVKKKTMEGSNPRYDTIQLNLDTQRLTYGSNVDPQTSDTLTSITLHRTLDIHSVDQNTYGSAFVVWEDGTMYAKDGYFEGTINAVNGYFRGTLNATDGWFTGTINAGSIISPQATIGNVTLGQVADSAYKTVISSSAGMTFKNGGITTNLTASLYKGATEVPTSSGTFAYTWYENNIELTPAVLDTKTYLNLTNNNQVLQIINFVFTGNISTITYDCIITYTESSTSS